MKWLNNNGSKETRIGLALPGGGARGAYQVGVLRAIARLLPQHSPTPFPIITGTSAGAINATALAINASNFRNGVLRLSNVWKNFRSHHVFRTDAPGIARTGLHWLAAMAMGGMGKHNPHSLLDREPLRQLLQHSLPIDLIQNEIDSGALYALGISATGYTSGQSVTFYQGADSVAPWERERRVGCPTQIGIDHLLASSAIPFIFSAIRINREYFGDGSMRQMAPISPVLHLGADRVFVVGVREENEIALPREQVVEYPSMAQIAGHVLNSIFLDGLYSDLERLERINKTITLIPSKRMVKEGIMLRPVDVLTISPSKNIETIAKSHEHLLPGALRFLLKGIGGLGESDSTLLSYLLFEKGYCRELISLGYKDAMRQKEEIMAFLGIEETT